MVDQKIDQNKDKLRKLKIELSLKYTPDKGEVISIIKELKLSLKKHLIDVPPWGFKIILVCVNCDFETVVNPLQGNKLKWFCRSCGNVILYDILG
jgi:hypothetical protein